MKNGQFSLQAEHHEEEAELGSFFVFPLSYQHGSDVVLVVPCHRCVNFLASILSPLVQQQEVGSIAKLSCASTRIC
jgi:hypothetical protein